MNQNPDRPFGVRLRQFTLMLLAVSGAGPSLAAANVRETVLVVPPAELPAGAQHGGESMLLSEAPDGRTLLYIEQDGGATLAVLDVTEPGHVRGEGYRRIQAAEPYEFVALLGTQTELVRFRATGLEAILDLSDARTPILRKLPRAEPVRGFGTPSATAERSWNAARSPATWDVQMLEPPGSNSAGRVVTVRDVRKQITNEGTGTTFLLTADGLYVIRRPALEPGRPLPSLDRYG